MSLTIGVPRELFPGEKRVASVPEVVEKLIKLDEISVSRDTRRKLLSISSATA